MCVCVCVCVCDTPYLTMFRCVLKMTVSFSSASKPKLTLSPGHQLLTGDSVTLTCELGVSSGLVFYWYRDTQTSDPVAQTDGNSYSIISVKVSDGGQYWCRAGRGDPVYHTPYSNEVWVNVTGEFFHRTYKGINHICMYACMYGNVCLFG